MKTGVVSLSVIPGRKEADDRSEMITQLLFGEEYEVLEEEGNWIKIKGNLDNYTCWIDKKQHKPSAKNEIEIISSSIGEYLNDNTTGEKIWLSPGSIIRKDFLTYNDSEDIDILIKGSSLSDIKTIAKQFLGTPYLWGGKTQYGIDCSGFTQVVMRIAGNMLPRDAWQQAEIGNPVELSKTKEGDLAFFSSYDTKSPNKITHVGIILDDNKIIHASGWVRIDELDSEGIITGSNGEYSHRLIGIRSTFI